MLLSDQAIIGGRVNGMFNVADKDYCTRFGFYEVSLWFLAFCRIDRPVCLSDPEVGDYGYRPLYEVASSKLALKTHVDMLNKVQINYYAAGLHREGSKAVFRYTSLALADRFALLNAAFGEEGYKVGGICKLG